MRNPLTDSDRAELCHRVDLTTLMADDGVELRQSGNHYLAKLRPEEKTPSCHVYPPGVGRHGAKGWTWHDYGPGEGGDALAYLADVRGLKFADAVRFMAEKAGWWPDGWSRTENDATGSPTASRKPAPRTPNPISRQTPPELSISRQSGAVGRFLGHLEALHPGTVEVGKAYLLDRGCLADTPDPVAYGLPADLCARLASRLHSCEWVREYLDAGLLRLDDDGRNPRLPWWGECVLFVCRGRQGEPLYVVARRLEWKPGDKYGKYWNQPRGNGAVRYPFGLPSIYPGATGLGRAVKTAPTLSTNLLINALAGEVLLVEGIADALAAGVLGWPAIAMLSRPQAAGADDRHSAAARMLSDHLPALRDFRRVLVLPDADAGEKGDVGKALAARLVGWLRAGGCRAEVATLDGLLADVDPNLVGAGHKDLAEAAEAMLWG